MKRKITQGNDVVGKTLGEYRAKPPSVRKIIESDCPLVVLRDIENTEQLQI